MSKSEQANSTRAQTIKAPYQKPAFRYESVFETSALRCGKVQSTQSPQQPEVFVARLRGMATARQVREEVAS